MVNYTLLFSFIYIHIKNIYNISHCKDRLAYGGNWPALNDRATKHRIYWPTKHIESVG